MLGLRITDEVPQWAPKDLGRPEGFPVVSQGEAEPFLIDRRNLIARVQLVAKI
jgi:hypothetical protein